MRPDVALAFDRMAAAASHDGVSLTITSAFRSDAEQAVLFARHPDPKWVAPPGHSLHRYATELDLGSPGAWGWLAAHAGLPCSRPSKASRGAGTSGSLSPISPGSDAMSSRRRPSGVASRLRAGRSSWRSTASTPPPSNDPPHPRGDEPRGGRAPCRALRRLPSRRYRGRDLAASTDAARLPARRGHAQARPRRPGR
jgi:D-alanyl-D-alanine carboxypeptidase